MSAISRPSNRACASSRPPDLFGRHVTEPTDLELLELATPYALDAVTDDERAAIERLLAPRRVRSPMRSVGRYVPSGRR